MFGIHFKHNLLKAGVMRGKTDVHCHVLPGVDDGSPDSPSSLGMLRYMEQEMGLKRVWLTPHIMQDTPNDAASLRDAFRTFSSTYDGGIELSLAAEYMLDARFADHLSKGLLPLMGDRLLVETSYMSGPPAMMDMLLAVWHMGLRPVIAHPERYMYMDEGDYMTLKGSGYELQLNLLSLSGYYGRRPKVVAEMLLAKGLYDYIGTDLHHLDRYQDFLSGMRLTRKQIDAIEALFENNGERLDH